MMKIKLVHAPYIGRKIAKDLLNSGFVSFNAGDMPVAQAAGEVILGDITKEKMLEERVKEVLDQNENEMEFMQIDRRNMFWLVKKKMADEFGVLMDYEERYNRVAHEILEALWKKSLIEYSVSENRVKNIIYNAIEAYLKGFEEAEDAVFSRIEAMEKKIVPGSDEWEVVFEKLYEQELVKRGMA